MWSMHDGMGILLPSCMAYITRSKAKRDALADRGGVQPEKARVIDTSGGAFAGRCEGPP